MRKNLTSIVIAVLLIAGTGLILYPAISDYLNRKKATYVIHSYNEALENTAGERRRKIIAEAHEYNALISGIASDHHEGEKAPDYNDTLDLTGTGIMGYIDIDKINVELPIYHGVDEGVLQIGVGHIEGSSLPVGGEGTHCILSGHRGLPSARLFTDLDEMEIGDTFTITVLDEVLTYQVDQIKVVLPEDTRFLGTEPGKDYCTLVTCTPYGINTHRLLVRGIRVAGDERPVRIFVSNEAFKIDTVIVAPVIALPMLLVVIVVTVIVGKKRKKTDENKK